MYFWESREFPVLVQPHDTLCTRTACALRGPPPARSHGPAVAWLTTAHLGSGGEHKQGPAGGGVVRQCNRGVSTRSHLGPRTSSRRRGVDDRARL